MIKAIGKTIDKYHLLENGETVVVALSGGADSCALLWNLGEIAPIRQLNMVVAHFNHGLRGIQSDEDESFCRRLARDKRLLFITEKMKDASVPAGVSPEDYFRRQRYQFLDRVAREHQAEKIALGHHLNDQAETVLINIMRGSGLDGLKGFLPIRDGKYIRPMMEISRDEIRNYLHVNGIVYREDVSNKNTLYLRNRVRNELIPFLQEKYNPEIEKALVRMAEIVRRDDAWLNECVKTILSSPSIQIENSEASVSAEYFKSLHKALGFRVIKALLEGLAPEDGGFSSSHIQLLVDLATAGSTGKKISLPYGICARKEYDRIILQSYKTEKLPDYEYQIKIPGTVDLAQRRIMLSARIASAEEIDFSRRDRVYLDRDRISEPLIVRNRRRGDWFEPMGMQGKQKIKKLFIDRKIPVLERDRIALIADQKSVIWIENLHLSERVKVSPDTKEVLLVEINSHA